MNFEDEEYVRLYCKDTVTTTKVGWEGRLVLWEIIENLVVACRACNRRKGGRTPEQAGMVLR